jgi:hypothetical protein
MMGGSMGGPDKGGKEIDRVELGINFMRNPTVAGQPLHRLKGHLRSELTLSEEEVEEVLRRSGLQPEEPQYGPRTKRRLDERAASRYRRREAEERQRDADESAAALAVSPHLPSLAVAAARPALPTATEAPPADRASRPGQPSPNS